VRVWKIRRTYAAASGKILANGAEPDGPAQRELLARSRLREAMISNPATSALLCHVMPSRDRVHQPIA